MSAPSIIQTNFTAGELAPEAYGRVDVAKYNNAAKTLKNVIVQVLGGAKGRGGLRYVASTKDSTKQSRLIPYIFSRTQSYILEFGNLYMRVYKDGAQVLVSGSPYEIVTPYTEAMLADLDYVQGADTMFIAHQGVMIQQLKRYSHTDWRLLTAQIVNPPCAEIGTRPATTLTLSSAAVGNSRTATAGAATFLPADIGRGIYYLGGEALIVGITSSTVAVVNVTAPFASASLVSGEWAITGTPQAPCTPSNVGPAGSMTTLALGAVSVAAGTKAIEAIYPASVGYLTLQDAFGDNKSYTYIKLKVTGHGYTTGQTVNVAGVTPATYNGTYTIRSVTADVIELSSSAQLGAASVLGTVALSAAAGVGGWRSTDVGSNVRINGGVVRITAVIDANTAVGEVLKILLATSQAYVDSWSLEAPVWTSAEGFPRTVTINSQRLIAAGSTSMPQTIWGSKIGDSLNFLRGVEDDEAFAYNLDSREVNPIAYLPSNRALMAMTYGGEFTIFGGQEKPITPTNIQVNPQSTFGCALVRPILIGNQLFYIQRDGKVLRAASYQLESDAYISPDISKLSKHLMTSPIISIAYQQSPYSCIWMVRADGKAISITIDNEENVIAWAWHETDGLIESIACIPGSDGQDQLWAVVKRTINSVVKRYVERMDDAVHTDACLTGTSGTATTAWGGLTHLEGKTVKVVADGVPIADCVVASAAITTEVAALSVEIGLAYTPTVSMLTPELPGPLGTSQGKAMRISKATAYLLETVGCHINGDPVEFRRLDTTLTLDSPVAPFTGTHELSVLGWNRGEAELTFEQRAPLPFHLLAVIRRFEANG